MSEFYDGRQFVGMDLHRRRSVLVRMSETGEHLETVWAVRWKPALNAFAITFADRMPTKVN